MAEEYDLEAVIRFSASGQPTISSAVARLQKALDRLRKTGAITEDSFQALAKQATVLGKSLENNLAKGAAAAALNVNKLSGANERAFASFLAEGAANDKAYASAQAAARAKAQQAAATQRASEAAKSNAAAIKAEDAARKAELAGLRSSILARQQDNEGLARQRYALYDLATTYGVLSAAALAASIVSVKAAADFETAFTGVERTLDPTYAAVGDLRKELVDLSTQIPLTFQDVSKIAQLGNQLGIAGESVAGFTETVAQFATVSGMSVDETAQAFGRLQSLLGVSADDFDRLGSSIALVGVNSAATEAQIVAIAKEIAPFTRAAGFGADGAIGLSGALASLAVAPERARSAIQQFSTQLRTSVAEGGQSLENFAALTGMTTDELDKLVRSGQDGDKIFRAFLETLSSGDPVQITQALDALGLSNLRVDTTIQALTQNLPLLDRALSDASQGYEENAELARQYGFIVDDLNSQFMLFVNSLNALVATLSGGAASGLADLLSQVTGLVNGFREFAEANEWIIGLAAGAIALTTIVGLLTAYRTANLLAAASTLALRDAQLAVNAGSFASGIRGLIGALFGYTAATQGATVATKAFRIALISTGIGALVVALGYGISLFTDFEGTIRSTVDVMQPLLNITLGISQALAGFYGMIADGARGLANAIPAFNGLADALANVANGLGSYNKVFDSVINGSGLNKLFGTQSAGGNNMTAIFGDLSDIMGQVTDDSVGMSDGLGDVGRAAGGAANEIRTLVDYANDLSGVFNRSFEIRFGSQAAFDTITSAWRDLNEQMDEYRRKVQELTADRTIKEYFLTVANAFDDDLRAGVLQSEIADLNAEISDAVANSSTELNGNSKAAITNRRRLEQLTQNYQAYITALANSGADQATLNAAVDRATLEFTDQARALGYSNAQITPYIAQLRSLTTVINAIPRNITISPNLDPAIQALNEFAARATSAGASAGAGFAAGMNAGLARVGRGMELQNEITKQQATLAEYLQSGNISGARYLGQYIAQLIARLRSGSYASGGYTGRGGKYEPAGIVHRGEYVIRKEDVNQRTGRPYADALGNLQRGTRSNSYASGGYVGGGNSGPVIMLLDQAQYNGLRRAMAQNGGNVNAQSIQGVVNSLNAQSSTLGRA